MMPAALGKKALPSIELRVALMSAAMSTCVREKVTAASFCAAASCFESDSSELNWVSASWSLRFAISIACCRSCSCWSIGMLASSIGVPLGTAAVAAGVAAAIAAGAWTRYARRMNSVD